MATIGTLNVALTVSTAKFAAGLSSARATVAKFSNALTSVKGVVAGFAAALGVGLTASAFKSLVQSSSEAIDSMAKLSDSIGITTEDLAGLQHAANLAGTDSASLAASLKKMVVNIGQGDKSFGKLGLNVKELQNVGAGEAFRQIADAINKLPTPAQRAAAAVEIFGKSGAALLPTLASGRAGLDAMAQEAQKLGLTFSRVDAAQVEAANDALTRVKEVITGVGNTLAIQLAPYIEAAANKFIELATSGEGIGAKIAAGMQFVGKSIGVVLDVIDALQLGFKFLQLTAAQSMAGLVAIVASAVELMQTQINNLLTAVGQAPVSFADGLSKFSDTFTKQVQKAEKDFDKAMIAEPPSKAWNKFFTDIANQGRANAIKNVANLDPKYRNVAAERNPALDGPFRPAAAAMFGSREAFTAISRFRGGSADKTQEQILREQREIRILDRQILEAIKAQQAPVQVAF